jgi:hypothetical protein
VLRAVKETAERLFVWLVLLAFCGVCWFAVARWVLKLYI